MKTARRFIRLVTTGSLTALATLSSPLQAIDAVDVQHAVIHYAAGKYCGMPAFHGAQQWQWGDEILTG